MGKQVHNEQYFLKRLGIRILGKGGYKGISMWLTNSVPPIKVVANRLYEFSWFIYADVFFEPILFTFTLFIMFPRFQAILDNVSKNPQSGLWGGFVMDMNTHPTLYSVFFIILFIWFLVKLIRFAKEQERDKLIASKLDKIITILEQDKGEKK